LGIIQVHFLEIRETDGFFFGDGFFCLQTCCLVGCVGKKTTGVSREKEEEAWWEVDQDRNLCRHFHILHELFICVSIQNLTLRKNKEKTHFLFQTFGYKQRHPSSSELVANKNP